MRRLELPPIFKYNTISAAILVTVRNLEEMKNQLHVRTKPEPGLSCHSHCLWGSADTRAELWPQTPAILTSVLRRCVVAFQTAWKCHKHRYLHLLLSALEKC